MAEFTEEFYYEYPDGYEPAKFKEPEVRSLEELRSDLTSAPGDWREDLMATLTELYLPAEEQYEENEILRRLRFRIEDPDDDSPFSKEELELELEMLTGTYDAGEEIAQEQIREAFDEEVKRHALAGLRILESSADYEAKEEDLLAGYEPAPEDPAVPAPVRERVEAMRRLSYQISRLDEDEDLLAMRAPFEILTEVPEAIGGVTLTPEDQQLVSRDIAHKTDLNRRFATKFALEDELTELAADLLQDENLWLEGDSTFTLEDWDTIDELRQEILNDQAGRVRAA